MADVGVTPVIGFSQSDGNGEVLSPDEEAPLTPECIVILVRATHIHLLAQQSALAVLPGPGE